MDDKLARGLVGEDEAQLVGTKSRENALDWKRSLSGVGRKMKAWLVGVSRDKDANLVETRVEKKHWTEL